MSAVPLSRALSCAARTSRAGHATLGWCLLLTSCAEIASGHNASLFAIHVPESLARSDIVFVARLWVEDRDGGSTTSLTLLAIRRPMLAISK